MGLPLAWDLEESLRVDNHDRMSVLVEDNRSDYSF
jgi:hypothetical protein